MSLVRWKLTLAFDGRRFYGWQRQPDQRTVQGELEKALTDFANETTHVFGQGRTDRGVHALGQTAHVDLPERVTAERLFGAMHTLLPDDMRLVRAEPVASDFHARFHAVARRYRYQVATRPDLLNRHQRWEIGYTPDLTRLNRYASLLTGRHDFAPVARVEPDNEHSTICTIKSSQWIEEPGGLCYTIEGDRFLRHLVRRLVGTMIRMEAAGMSPDEWEVQLAGGPDGAQIHGAPAHGLLLLEVRYA